MSLRHDRIVRGLKPHATEHEPITGPYAFDICELIALRVRDESNGDGSAAADEIASAIREVASQWDATRAALLK